MARRLTLRDQIIASAQATMSKGAGHAALLAEIESNAQKYEEAVKNKAARALGDRTDQPDTSTGQTDRTDQPDRPIGHINRTVVPDTPIGVSGTTVRSVCPVDVSGWSVRSDTLTGQTDRSDSPIGLSDRTHRPDTRTGQTDRTDPPDRRRPEKVLARIKLTPRSPLSTPAQTAVYRYFQINGSHVTTYDVISNETGIPRGTLRAVIRKFEAVGILKKNDWWQGNARALAFTFFELGATTGQTDRTDRPDTSTGQTNRTHQRAVMKIDREKNLSISQERIELTWPALARHGFGVAQVEQILHALAELGTAPDRVVQGLHHAEWELENGKMLDKSGAPVADPCSWVFRSLARTGYYRKPPGYVSPEEQALLDAEETAKRLTATRQRAEQAQYEAWRAGLTPEAFEAAMVGYVGGPREQWLKSQWTKKYRTAPGAGGTPA
uniref:Uncharacterized protein n=1 Tax=Desulfovibrio sp. U5L TaxID=596152 RepID=I2Q7Q7_9BACT